ncbi:MAG TPA: hypothetical protein VNW92_00190 [Polyangiaceae bacterium]|nr:hypothetical protein [Polyangiaceae bacterium]
MNPDRPPNDETIARLLARREGPSVLQKEALFEQIYRQIPHESARPRWPFGLLAFGCVLAVTLGLALWRRPAGSEFASRGAPPPALPRFAAGCVGGPPPGCRAGGRLAFEVTASEGRHYFAAFARRSDGVVIWYFPEENGLSLPFPGGAASLLDRAVELGAEQPPGHYEVYGVFSARALTRAEIKRALGDDLRGRDGVSVVVQSLEVLP